MPRCYSKCKGVSKDLCVGEKCNYINGNKRKYCTLSRKFYLDKKCNTIRKTKKLKLKKYNKTLHKALNNHVKSQNLQAICSDSSVCIAFGKQSDDIKQFFDNYSTFKYLNGPLKRIGKVSVNGFVFELNYSRLNYNSYAVLKCASPPDPDNLYYEYLVGLYVNKLNKRFPCFVETYDCYLFANTITYQHFKANNNIDPEQMKNAFYPTPVDYRSSCVYPTEVAILVQHVKNANTLFDMCKNKDFAKDELICALYQVYSALSYNKDTFTHYDLHGENVLIYEPKKGGYITYNYHFPAGEIVSFDSRYIAKIIDYGRCYFNDKEAKIDSLKIHKKVCNTPKCDPTCGIRKGYYWLRENPPNPASQIASAKNNISHDLRLINTIKGVAHMSLTLNLFTKLVYNHAHGTSELKASGLPSKVHNVEDAFNVINNIVKNQMSIHVKKYSTLGYATTGHTRIPMKKMGDLHVYIDGTDRPMKYEEI